MTPNLKQQCERLAEEYASKTYDYFNLECAKRRDDYTYDPYELTSIEKRGYERGFTAAVPLVQAEEREKTAKLLEAIKEFTEFDRAMGYPKGNEWMTLISQTKKAIAEYEK